MDILSRFRAYFLMIAVISTSVTGKKGLGPMAFVKNFYGTPDTDHVPYIELQRQLEDIAENTRLHDLPESEKEIEEKNLLSRPDVQSIVNQCKHFHTEPNCGNLMYRSHDGSCNNLKHLNWGSYSYSLNRLMPANYRGVKGFRKSVTGGDLPEPRNISLQLKNENSPSELVSAFYTFFGQIVAHDMSSTPSSSKDGASLHCCEMKNNSLCKNILFRKDDPFFHQFNVRCWPFPRSVPYPTCNLEKRTPMNKQTAFLDASTSYGNNEKVAEDIRAKDGNGRLKVQDSEFGPLLQENKVQDFLFCPHNETNNCFTSGDPRLNLHTMLSSMHTLLNTFHNVLAEKLQRLNPEWGDEMLYQEARRILIALHQNNVYREYLPWLTSPELLDEYQLSVDVPSSYNEAINPNIAVEFATAAFRLHSMVPKTIAKNYPRTFDKIYSFPQPLHKGKFEPLVAGSCEVPSEQNDNFIMGHVKNYLFRPPGADYGSDIASINIQRGRDHGLPTYADMVQNCSKGNININNFSDLIKKIPRHNIKILKRIYKDVSDIDLWVGILMEKPLDKCINGFTAACISAQQFHRIKYGDRFFFTHTNNGYPFTSAQLNSIKNYSLVQMICHSGDFTTIRRKPLLLPSEDNDLVSCQSLPLLNLEPWKVLSKDG